jgi:hypothetical protein
MAIQLSSTAFQQGTSIPTRYTGDGADQSPPLHWSNLPAATKSLALICDDPDAPRGTWVHWVLFNLPPANESLDEAIANTPVLPNGARQGRNDFGSFGYGGPAPPKGKAHRYFFKLYALSESLNLAPGCTKAELEAAMQGIILAHGELMGTYQR